MTEITTTLRVIPLGGLGEIGMNLMLYELGDSSIVVDCGMMFPDAATLGVDVVIPDMTYLFENASKLRAVFLTHGHEDHIGALPFLVEKISVPVYGMPLTLGFLRNKLEELGVSDQTELRVFEPRDVVEAGPFRVEAIRVTHSIVDSIALAIHTPAGTIIHTGDFKIDHTPVDGRPTDISRLAAHGEEGVLLLLSDSTNALVTGSTPSEKSIGNAFDRIIGNAKGRVIVTTFSSHIHRIQLIVDAALRRDRRVYFIGRSVVRNVEIAERLGHLHIPREARPHTGRTPGDDPRAVIITTGTQGEPASALARMALNEHKSVALGPGDIVVISARTIPGNERAVIHVVDHLVHRGAEVIWQSESDVHVSGHAAQEELKLMINLTRPRFFIPMHGTLRHMTMHGRLAESVGILPENIFVITNGAVVEIDGQRGAVLEERVPTGKVFIDQQLGEVSDIVVRDRKHLAEDGFVIVVAAMDVNTGRLVRDPEIITRGFVHVDTSAEILGEIREMLVALFDGSAPLDLRDAEAMQEKMRSQLKRFFRKKLNSRPMILPVVWEM